MAREEKRPSGRKSYGSKPTSSAPGRSNSSAGRPFNKYKKEGDSNSRPKRTFSSGASDKPKSYRGTGDFKKSFGEKSYGDKPFVKKTYGDKPSGSGREKSFGDKPKRAYGSSEGRFSSAPKREGGFRKDNEGEARPRFGEKKSFGEKSFGDKPPFGDKPSFGKKPYAGGKTFGDKPKRSFGSKDNEGGEAKSSFGRKPFGESSERPKREGGFKRDNAGSDRPRFGDKKPFGDKPSFGDKPKRSFRSRDNEGGEEKRSFGRKPFGESSERPKREGGFKRDNEGSDRPRFGDKKPFGDKPSFGDKPKRSFGSRDNEGGEEKRSFGRKPFGESSERPKREGGFKRDNEGDARPRFGDKKPFGDKPSFNDKPKRSFGANSSDEDVEKRPFERKSKSDNSFKDFEFDKPKKSDDDFIASDFEKAAKYADEKPKKAKETNLQPLFKESISDSKEGIRLNKYIANSGISSRREADVLISQGLVSVNGEVITELGVIVKRNDVVKYDGRTLNPEKNVYVLLNKPKDFITTTNDPQERKTVMNLVANACKERIYPVGRLDRNTTGLLLFTNDGELAEKLTHPSHKIKKIYQVELDRPITPEDSQLMLDGLYFEEGRATLDSMAVLDESKKVIGLELHIGWNRIVRRIFEAKGYEVARLDRVLYAGLTKKDLPRGEWRFLTEKEVISLKYPQRT